MEHTLLEMLLNNGEDTKVDYKKTVQIKSKTDHEGRAEFIRDVLSIANAHDETTGYILIGVDEDANSEDQKIVDIKSLGLDDADIHAFVDEYISAPVAFSFRHVECRGKTIGVVEIPFSDNSFHFVAKDYKGETGKVLVPRGQCLIRRGTKKSPVTGYDSQRLKEYHVKQFTNTPQPNLLVQFLDVEGKYHINQTLSTEATIVEHTSLDQKLGSKPVIIQYPQFTFAIYFAVFNAGTIQADNVIVDIRLPAGCSVYKHKDNVDYSSLSAFLPDTSITSTYRTTEYNPSLNLVRMRLKHLLHNLCKGSGEVLVTFPELGKTYEFVWIAHAGNMAQPTTGKLQVMIG